MKKLLLVVSLIFALISDSNGQSSERKFCIGPWGGFTQYNGDLGQGFYDFSQGYFGHAGLAAGWYVTEHWDFFMNATYGSWGYKESDINKFRTSQLQWNSHFRLNILSSDKYKIIPYLFGGVGIAYLEQNALKPGADIIIPFGGGVRFRLTDNIDLHLQESFNYTDHDTRDYATGNDNDAFLMQSIGVTYSFGQSTDSDHDGVSDAKDQCPATPAGAKVDAKGCPADRDGDGIADIDDKCPDVKGVASANGCPDKDGDGVADKDDLCPEVKGSSKTQGCSDRDLDGVRDAEDRCPDVFGLVALKGCPDSDEDSIPDIDDRCPSLKGPIKLNGCPDQDGDGIIDIDDKCPSEPGIAENKGCPPVKEEVKKVFNEALQGIQFETGKDVITISSYRILDKVVDIMKNNMAYLLTVEGHTDNVGSSEANLTLSQKRADAVKAYISTHDVWKERIKAIGYGDTKPVGDNKTAAGRAKNRRVEFKISF